jgi:ABC-type amino acid transport substrate-binding protein
MNRTIRIGADPFPPYQSYCADGSVRGIDADRVTAAFRAAGYDTEIILEDWPVVERMLNDGAVSAAFQVQPTPERLKKYRFSKLLRSAATELISSRAELKLDSYRQIEERNLTLGVIEGYTNGPDIDALDSRVKRTYPDNRSLLLAISRGETDLGVFDRGVKTFLMEENGIHNLYPVENMTFTRPLHVIFLDEALCGEFDAALERL